MRLFSRTTPRTPTPFLSALYLLRCAAALSVLFFAAHLAGLREFTSILNGTIGSIRMTWETAALLGTIYIGFYLAFVLLVPALILAAAILSVGNAFQKRNNSGFRTETALAHPMSEPTSPASGH
jgi:hypothetical protein